jgi:hypothetical protein
MANKKIIDLDLPSLPLGGAELMEMSVDGTASVKVELREALISLWNDSTAVLTTTMDGVKSAVPTLNIKDFSENNIIVIEDSDDVIFYADAEKFAMKFTGIIAGKGNFVEVRFSDETYGPRFTRDVGSFPTDAWNLTFNAGAKIITGNDVAILCSNNGSVYLGYDGTQKFYTRTDGVANRGTGTEDVYWLAGNDSPEGVYAASVGSIYSRTNGGTGSSLYIKESGSLNTGWVAVA